MFVLKEVKDYLSLSSSLGCAFDTQIDIVTDFWIAKKCFKILEVKLEVWDTAIGTVNAFPLVKLEKYGCMYDKLNFSCIIDKSIEYLRKYVYIYQIIKLLTIQ